jgi:hypothetical protein
MLNESIRKQLLRFCNGETPPQAFEEWACAESDLEDQIGHGAYLDLISADYRGRERPQLANAALPYSNSITPETYRAIEFAQFSSPCWKIRTL